MNAVAPNPASFQPIQLDTSPNQTWQVTVVVDGVAATYFVVLDYNEIAQYWAMSIYDSNQNLLVAGIPLVTGLNTLRQYQYLGIGSIYIVNTGASTEDYPDDTNLGSAFQMIWADATQVSQAQ